MFGQIKEECGVFGMFAQGGSEDVVGLTYLALYALQHRGQESCGIAVNDDGLINHHRDTGLVNEVFTRERLERLGKGQMAVGHVRYSTTGTHNRENSQPLVVRHIKGTMAIAHNGNITNARELRAGFERGGAIFQSTTDSEVLGHMIIKERLSADSIEQSVEAAMTKLSGAYCLVVMSPTKLIAARDPIGFRPLCMGKIGESIVFASESCALDSVGAEFIRDVKPGEIVVVSKEGVRSIQTHIKSRAKLCVFEFIYFARPDSIIEGASVHSARLEAGRLLAKSDPALADVVIGVPDSGLDAALGFSRESGIPYGIGFIKNRYVGRTFIQPTQGQRETTLGIKLNALTETVSGKRVVMVDDSIVRGTTSRRIVGLLRAAGAREVHMRVSAPPFRHPCYFGTDIDAREKLIANQMNIDEIAQKIGVDSLCYLSVENARIIAQGAQCDFCTGCFNGSYPISVPSGEPKDKFEQRISERG